jgi:hypothetical protein
VNTRKEIKETKFEELFKNKENAVACYLSLENRYQEAAQRLKKMYEIYNRGECPFREHAKKDKRPCS